MARNTAFALLLLGSLCIAGCGGSSSGGSGSGGSGGGGGGGTQKTTPTISAWPTASAITFGQTLASSTLTGGTSSVTGTFAWTTPSTAPSAGTPSESVTFTPSDTTDYNTVAGSVAVTVNKATPAISAWPTASAITYGQTLASSTLTGGTASVPGAFAWTSPNTVPATGTDSEGATFTPTDATDYVAVTGSISVSVGKATPTVTWANPAAITYGTVLSGTQLNATANISGTFVYSPVAGTILTAGSGTLSTTFTPNDAADYNTATKSVQITVNKATPTVSAWPSASAITYGQTLALSSLTGGTASTSGTFAWTTPSTAPSAGTPSESITFTPNDTTDYNTAAGSVTVTVNKAIPTVSAWPTASVITSGQALSSSTLTGGTASVPGTFAWTSPNTVPAVGMDAESVTFTPTDATDYTTVAGSVMVTATRTPPSGSWQPAGPPGGTVTVLAEDPSNPSTIYAGTEDGGNGGFWKSTDAGVTWTSINTNSGMDYYPISDIAVANAGQTIYASSSQYPYFFWSNDAGNTWNQVQTPNGSINGMAVDPKASSTIYLSAVGAGVLKSVDGGKDWALLTASPAITPNTAPGVLHGPIAVDPTTTTMVYYGTDHGLYISSNGGSTWSASSNGIASADTTVIDLTVDPAAPSSIFLLIGIPSSTVADLYVSTNGGSSWTPLAGGLDAERIVPDPSVANVIYLYGLAVHAAYKSTDGGHTFVPSDTGTPSAGSSGSSSPSLTLTGPTGTMIPVTSNPGTYLMTIGESGIYQTQNAAQSWSFSSQGLSAWFGSTVAFDPQVPATIYFGANNGAGIFRSTDSGLTWNNLRHDSPTAIAVDPFDSTHILAAATDEGLIESRDGGASWTNVSSALPPPPTGKNTLITGINFYPTQKGTIFVSTEYGGVGLIRSTDGGTTYSTDNDGLTSTDVEGCLAVNPQNPEMMIIIDGAGVATSTDGGNSWVESSAPVFCPFSVDTKSQPSVVYAEEQLTPGTPVVGAKSADFGNTWTALNVSPPLLADPSTAGSVFSVTSWSPDGGATWMPLLDTGLGLGEARPDGGFGPGFVLAPSEPQALFVVSYTNGILRFDVGP